MLRKCLALAAAIAIGLPCSADAQQQPAQQRPAQAQQRPAQPQAAQPARPAAAPAQPAQTQPAAAAPAQPAAAAPAQPTAAPPAQPAAAAPAQAQAAPPAAGGGWGSQAEAQSEEDIAADMPADAERGRTRAAENCVNCHGADGRSPTSAVPSLAGQPAPFIVMQMVLFRNDMRDTPPMPDFARELSEQEVEDLAAFFASLPAGPPEDREPRNEERFRQGAAVAERLGCPRCHYADYVGRNQVPRVARPLKDGR